MRPPEGTLDFSPTPLFVVFSRWLTQLSSLALIRLHRAARIAQLLGDLRLLHNIATSVWSLAAPTVSSGDHRRLAPTFQVSLHCSTKSLLPQLRRQCGIWRLEKE
ncbi:unnamed protein product [Protopolystoma xenopodis]|uniref:Uncharacterized protein n=1 Tax=Protopolystoma xenopodis TaxID=117903 RepID=A0A3S4ZV98_9PLAT|nr:unnamed protein product [Protopolystoma xenopodis]